MNYHQRANQEKDHMKWRSSGNKNIFQKSVRKIQNANAILDQKEGQEGGNNMNSVIWNNNISI